VNKKRYWDYKYLIDPLVYFRVYNIQVDPMQHRSRSKRKSIRRKSIRSQRGSGPARCNETPILKYVLNNPGDNCYRIREQKTMDDYIATHNPMKSKYIADFLRKVKRLWDMREDLKNEIGMTYMVPKIDKVTSSETLRWKLFDFIRQTFSTDELKRLKSQYLDKLDTVHPDVLRVYTMRYRKLGREHQGIIQYVGK
jgi:hypothetical protein